MRVCTLIVLLLVSACASGHAPVSPLVSNPWQVKAESLARSGVAAMEREEWGTARTMFERSLQAATLVGDEHLMALGWYNLGRSYAAGGDLRAAHRSYQQGKRQAEAAGDAVNSKRAALALALLENDGRQAADDLLHVPVAFPIDVHLAAARLGMLRDRSDAARQAYARVLDMAGKDRNGLLYAARSHLGMAELEYATDRHATHAVWPHLNAAMELLRRAGQPRLMLQAVNLAVKLEDKVPERQRWEQRAADLQRALQTAHSD